jgi:hypothetical protein
VRILVMATRAHLTTVPGDRPAPIRYDPQRPPVTAWDHTCTCGCLAMRHHPHQHTGGGSWAMAGACRDCGDCLQFTYPQKAN